MTTYFHEITCTDENLDALYTYGEEALVSYALSGLMNLREQTRKSFFNFIRLEYPWLEPILPDLY